MISNMVAEWLVHRTQVAEVWVQYLARSLCWVLEQNTLHSLCLLPPRSTNRSVELSGKPDEMLTGGKGWWGNLAMNWHPIQRGECSWSLYAKEGGISSGWMGHLVQRYLLPYFLFCFDWVGWCITKLVKPDGTGKAADSFSTGWLPASDASGKWIVSIFV